MMLIEELSRKTLRPQVSRLGVRVLINLWLRVFLIKIAAPPNLEAGRSVLKTM